MFLSDILICPLQKTNPLFLSSTNHCLTLLSISLSPSFFLLGSWWLCYVGPVLCVRVCVYVRVRATLLCYTLSSLCSPALQRRRHRPRGNNLSVCTSCSISICPLPRSFPLSLSAGLSVKLDLQQIVVLLVISPHIRCHMGGAEQQ